MLNLSKEATEILGSNLVDSMKAIDLYNQNKERIMNKSKVYMECLECGHKFLKTISSNTVEVRCPKCRGYDTEVV